MSRRRNAGMAIAPISYLEIDAFSRLTGMRLLAWQIDVIERLDELWMKSNG